MSKRLEITLPPAMKAQAAEAARKAGESLARYVREAIAARLLSDAYKVDPPGLVSTTSRDPRLLPEWMEDAAEHAAKLPPIRHEPDAEPVGIASLDHDAPRCQCYEGSVGCLGPPCVPEAPRSRPMAPVKASAGIAPMFAPIATAYPGPEVGPVRVISGDAVPTEWLGAEGSHDLLVLNRSGVPIAVLIQVEWYHDAKGRVVSVSWGGGGVPADAFPALREAVADPGVADPDEGEP